MKREYSKYVATMDWAGNVVVDRGDGKIFSNKRMDLIFNGDCYPNKTLDEWPINPETGLKLPADEPS